MDYTVNLPSGKVIEVKGAPEGLSRDELKAGIISRGSATEEDFAAPAQEQTEVPAMLALNSALEAGKGAISQFVPKIQEKIPTPAQMPYGTSQAAIDAANAKIQQQNEYEKSFIGDEQRQALKKLEEERPFISGMIEGFGETLKQFNAGTKLSPDWMPEGLQKILDYRIGGDNTMSRQDVEAELKKEMANNKERYAITREENPFSTALGESIPFLFTGAVGSKGIGAVESMINQPLKRGTIAASEALGKHIPDLAKSAQRLKNKPAQIKTAGQERTDEFMKGVLTGAAEGAAQYDTNATQGAMGAALGILPSMGFGFRSLNSVKNEGDVARRELINKMNEEGFQITPGMHTGNATLLKEEAGIRNSDAYGQEYLNMVERPNQRRMMDMAGEGIGMNLKDRDRVSQTELANHMKSLSDQYQALENNTIGVMGSGQLRRAGQIMRDLKPTKTRNTSPDDMKRYQTARSIFDQFRKEIGTPTLQNGIPVSYVFNGSDYQKIRQRVQDEMSQAYRNGDNRLGDKLGQMKEVLDESLANGMGTVTAKQWKDLNERYAMTNLFMKNGLTESGMLDVNKLSNAMMTDREAARTLTGQGGRIKRFQDIARYNDVLNGKDVPGGDLTGLGERSIGSERGLLRRAKSLILDPAKELSLSYRLNTNRTPLIGPYLSLRHGFGQHAGYRTARALQQGANTPKMLSDWYDEMTKEQDKEEGR